MTPEERLAGLGLALPEAQQGIGHYASWARTGRIIMTSGQFPWRGPTLAYSGQVGSNLSEEDGYQSAKLSALNAIAQLSDATGGDLSKISQILRLEGHVFCTEGFSNHAQVINGASDLFNAVFPDLGKHSRAVHGSLAMPINSTTLLYVYAEIAD